MTSDIRKVLGAAKAELILLIIFQSLQIHYNKKLTPSLSQALIALE